LFICRTPAYARPALAAYEEEQEKIEDDWRQRRTRVQERMLEAIEERRRKAREEKDGEGAGG
jgi:hypothetical protein